MTEALIALGGADLCASVDGTALPPWRPACVRAGAVLTFAGSTSGTHAYLAVGGGIDVPLVMGSRSTDLRFAFGGFEGRALRRGDEPGLGSGDGIAHALLASMRAAHSPCVVARWGAGPSMASAIARDPIARIVAGAHAHMLTQGSLDALVSRPFSVTSRSDRMGYRLGGTTLELRERGDLLSEGVTFGTMQLPPGGDPIVLMAERQTTGGYPRIAEVATVDLGILAQVRPGGSVRFRWIGVSAAQEQLIERERDLAMLRVAVRLRAARGG
jgi:antagonist of KipI